MSALYDIHQIVGFAALNDELRAQAVKLFAGNITNALGDKEPRRELHASMAGQCIRQTWADVHGECDLPLDPDTVLTRFDLGNLYGSWVGALFKVGLEHFSPHLEAVLEADANYRGVIGHIDALVKDRMTEEVIWIVEFKSTYSTGPSIEAWPFQIIQAAQYALAHNCEDFTVYTTAPATQWRKSMKPVRGFQFDFLASSYKEKVDEEIDRLQAALGDVAPEGDVTPAESWRCRECRFSNCIRNPHFAEYHEGVAV